jgi:hypothetical protein
MYTYTLEDLRAISTHDLAALGLQDVAYIKRVTVDGKTAYAVHAADGTPIAVLANREVAYVAVRQHELEPVSVH